MKLVYESEEERDKLAKRYMYTTSNQEYVQMFSFKVKIWGDVRKCAVKINLIDSKIEVEFSIERLTLF